MFKILNLTIPSFVKKHLKFIIKAFRRSTCPIIRPSVKSYSYWEGVLYFWIKQNELLLSCSPEKNIKTASQELQIPH